MAGSVRHDLVKQWFRMVKLPLIRLAAIALACVLSTVSSVPSSAEGLACPRSGLLKGDLRGDGLRKRLARGQAVHLLAIGSSSTEGIGASSKAAAYPALLEGDLRAAWPGAKLSVENAGIGGETAPATLARLEQRLASTSYDLVIWQVGTNDALSGADTNAFRAMLRKGISAARDARVEIALLNQQYFPGIKNPAAYDAFVAAVADVAREERVPVIDRYALMTGWKSAGDATLLASLSGDRFHMGDAGYACLAQVIAADIAETVGPARAIPVAGSVFAPGL
jgi:acyl-CoA thioesterase I